MYTQDRTALRQVFIDAWHKYQNQMILEPQEDLIVEVIQMHPEYHKYIVDDSHIDTDFQLESQQNPFLHLSLHIAIKEQLRIDSPTGICGIYNKLLTKVKDIHTVEHEIMSALMEVIYKSQKENSPLDNASYVKLLNGLLG